MVRGRDNYYHSRVKLVTITGATARAVNTSRFRFSVVPPLPLARRRIDCGFVGQIITIINHHLKAVRTSPVLPPLVLLACSVSLAIIRIASLTHLIDRRSTHAEKQSVAPAFVLTTLASARGQISHGRWAVVLSLLWWKTTPLSESAHKIIR